MANWILDWAFKQKLKPAKKFVLVALANRADKVTATCFPSLQTIMDDTCLTKTPVTNALKELEQLGKIRRTKRWIGVRQCTSTLYELLVPLEDTPMSLKRTPSVRPEVEGCSREKSQAVLEKDREPLRRTQSEPQANSLESQIEYQQVLSGLGSEEEIGRRIMDSLRGEMGKENYDRYAAPIQLLSNERLEESRISLRFSVPNAMLQQWWQRNVQLMKRAVAKVGTFKIVFCEFELER